MARLPKQKIVPGTPDKPESLSTEASAQWDRLLLELDAAAVPVTRAHRALVAIAATTAADIREAWKAVQKDGAYISGKGGLCLHPAARRMDALRRDYLKALSLLGLRTPVAPEKSNNGPSLEEILNG